MNQSQQKSVILVIDDEPEVLREVSAVLTEAGHTCHCCATAEAAEASVESTSPDLIVCDINLSGESGLVLCEKLKQQPSMSNVPMMFLSGAQIPDIIRRSHAAGGTYYLRKPFDPSVLVELVDKALWMPHLVDNHMAQQRTLVGQA